MLMHFAGPEFGQGTMRSACLCFKVSEASARETQMTGDCSHFHSDGKVQALSTVITVNFSNYPRPSYSTWKLGGHQTLFIMAQGSTGECSNK